MKTRFFILCISVLVASSIICGCDEEIKKDALEKYIYVNKSSLNVFPGDKVQLKANPVGEAFEWTSVDPAIATVTSGGLVEAVGVGSTEIVVNQGTYRTVVPVTVTVPTVDRIAVASNEGQLQIAIQTLSERVTTARIIWNNNSNSIDIAVNNRIGVFTQNIDYPASENGFVFYVVSIDKYGNSSVPFEIADNIYSTNVIKLTSRQLTMLSFNDRVGLYWSAVESTVTKVAIRYVSSSGQTVETDIPFDETQGVIMDYKPGGTITVLTHHRPFPEKPDELVSSKEIAFPDALEEIRIPSGGFQNAALPGDYYTEFSSQFVLANVWDGTIGKLYATQILTPPRMPQYFTIDMGRTAVIYRFKMLPRSGNVELYTGAGPRFFELWGSMDPPADGSWDNWYKLGEWEQLKPSGYGAGADIGPITSEDITHFNSGGNYEVDMYMPVKFLRFQVNHSFASYSGAASSNIVIAELEFYGGMP
jgi:hypothetical protein